MRSIAKLVIQTCASPVIYTSGPEKFASTRPVAGYRFRLNLSLFSHTRSRFILHECTRELASNHWCHWGRSYRVDESERYIPRAIQVTSDKLLQRVISTLTLALRLSNSSAMRHDSLCTELLLLSATSRRSYVRAAEKWSLVVNCDSDRSLSLSFVSRKRM